MLYSSPTSFIRRTYPAGSSRIWLNIKIPEALVWNAYVGWELPAGIGLDVSYLEALEGSGLCERAAWIVT